MVRKQTVHAGLKRCRIGQISHADRPAAHLVFIGRADAAPCGADLGDAHGTFTRAIQFAMQRQDQRGILGNQQVLGVDGNTLPAQLGDLGDQMPGIKHHTIADDRQLATAHDTRRQQRQLVDVAADNQRMARVVSALKARDHVGPLAEPVNDLALPLVTPLGAHDDDIGHARYPSAK